MQRLADWSERLWRAMHERRNQPHTWCANDCVTYAAAMVEAQTGVDLLARWKPAYSDQTSAEAWLAQNGFDDLAALIDAHFERCVRPGRGDLVLLPGERGDFVAVALAGPYAMAPAGDRARIVPTRGMVAAWSVGRG